MAGGADLRPQLEEALQALQGTNAYARLPELFAARPAGVADAKELAYLNDALQRSIDLLLEHAGPDARLLLWIIALANDPVALGLLRGVWRGEGAKEEQIRTIRALLENLDQVPAELRVKLEGMPAEVREAIMAAPRTVPPVVPDLEPLLDLLVAVGLVTAERQGPADDNPEYTCHELVRERITVWMAAHPDERMGREENGVRLAYAQRLVSAFEALLHRDGTTALEAGRRALVYCVQAGAYDRLGSFASSLRGRSCAQSASPRLTRKSLRRSGRRCSGGGVGAPCAGHVRAAPRSERPREVAQQPCELPRQNQYSIRTG